MRARHIIVFALLLGACGRRAAPSQFTLRVAMVGPLDPLGPDRMFGYSGLAQEWVYQQIARVQEDGSLSAGLGTKFQRRGRDLWFEIEPGSKFSDGSDVRAADVIRALQKETLAARPEGGGILVEAPASGVPLDAVVPFIVVSRPSAKGALGSGPFRIASQSPTLIVLERIKPASHRIQRIELVGFATPREALARTLAGDTDLLPRVEPRLAEFFDHVDRLRLVQGRSSQAVSVAFNLRIGLSERRALASLLSRSDIGRTAFGTGCAAWPWPDSHRTLQPGRKLDVIGPQLDVGYERLALAARRALGDRGGALEILSVRDTLQRVAQGHFDLFASPALMWPPAAAYFKFHSNASAAGNFWGYADRDVDTALDAHDWDSALTALSHNPPLVFICLQERLVAVDSRVKDPRLGPLTLLEFVPEWEVGQ